MQRIRYLLFGFVLLAVLSGCIEESCGNSVCDAIENRNSCMVDCLELGIVERVIDGDTIVLSTGEKVRLIGIDTPEKAEPCFEEAKQKLQQLVEGKTIELERDIENLDKYNRLLRYIHVGGVFVNLEMVSGGFARAFPYEPSTKYRELFEEAQSNAMQKNNCLWGAIQ